MSYERLTDQQKNDILEAYKNGMPIKEMEEKFSVNNLRINRLVRKHNLEKRNKNRIIEKQVPDFAFDDLLKRFKKPSKEIIEEFDDYLIISN